MLVKTACSIRYWSRVLTLFSNSFSLCSNFIYGVESTARPIVAASSSEACRPGAYCPPSSLFLSLSMSFLGPATYTTSALNFAIHAIDGAQRSRGEAMAMYFLRRNKQTSQRTKASLSHGKESGSIQINMIIGFPDRSWAQNHTKRLPTKKWSCESEQGLWLGSYTKIPGAM